MATINLSVGTEVRRFRAIGGSVAQDFVLANKVDFSRNNGGSADVIQILNIPAKTFVHKVMHVVLTAEGGTTTGEVGDGADPDGWLDVNNNAAAGTTVVSNPALITLSEGAPNTYVQDNPYSEGKMYWTADTIDMTLSANAVATAVVVVQAWCTDFTVYG